MTLPKKGFRSITVNNTLYKYRVKGEDGCISIVIGLPNINGQVLNGWISYHSNYVSHFNDEGIAKSWSLHQRAIVTPKTIREVILYGLDQGWKPKENLKAMSLANLDDKIYVQLKEATEFPDLKNEEVVIVFQSNNKRLNLDFKPYEGEGNIYHKYDTIDLAKEFAKSTIKEHSNLSCWILNDFNKALIFIDGGGVVNFGNNKA